MVSAIWTRPRLPVLLSNQAKLEAKLESNPAFSHTTLQPPTAWLAMTVSRPAPTSTRSPEFQAWRCRERPPPHRHPQGGRCRHLDRRVPFGYTDLSQRSSRRDPPLLQVSLRRRGHAWHMDDEVLAAASALRATSPGGAALVLGGGFCGLAYATQLEPRASRRLDPLRDHSPHATNAPDPDRSATHTLAWP